MTDKEEGYIQCLELALDIGDMEGAGKIMDDPDYQDVLKKYQKKGGNRNESNKGSLRQMRERD